MKLIFFGEGETTRAYQCSMCGRPTREGYVPYPSNPNEDEKIEKMFGENRENWWICEKCLDGGCLNPTAWLSRFAAR